jgi:hypothetical protein
VAVQRDIYFSLSTGDFVQSNKSAQRVSFPSFCHQDNLRLILHPLSLEPSNTPAQGPFSEEATSGWSVVAKVFTSAGVEIAAQSSWTSDGNTLVGTIDCNTGAMTTAIGVATSISGYIEFELQDSSGYKITIGGHQFGAVTIYRELITSGTPANLASETYLTESASRSQFVPKVGSAGEGFYLTSADGLTTLYVYAGDDGELKATSVT